MTKITSGSFQWFCFVVFVVFGKGNQSNGDVMISSSTTQTISTTETVTYTPTTAETETTTIMVTHRPTTAKSETAADKDCSTSRFLSNSSLDLSTGQKCALRCNDIRSCSDSSDELKCTCLPPSNHDSPAFADDERYVIVSEPVILPCRVQNASKHNDSALWRYQSPGATGQCTNNTAKFAIYRHQLNDYHLLINQAELNDSGMYTCITWRRNITGDGNVHQISTVKIQRFKLTVISSATKTSAELSSSTSSAGLVAVSNHENFRTDSESTVMTMKVTDSATAFKNEDDVKTPMTNHSSQNEERNDRLVLIGLAIGLFVALAIALAAIHTAVLYRKRLNAFNAKESGAQPELDVECQKALKEGIQCELRQRFSKIRTETGETSQVALGSFVNTQKDSSLASSNAEGSQSTSPSTVGGTGSESVAKQNVGANEIKVEGSQSTSPSTVGGTGSESVTKQQIEGSVNEDDAKCVKLTGRTNHSAESPSHDSSKPTIVNTSGSSQENESAKSGASEPLEPCPDRERTPLVSL